MTVEQHESDHGNAGYEERDVNVRQVAMWGLIVIVALIVSVVFVWDYFVGTREEVVERVVLSPPSPELRELRAREEEELGNYKLLDSASGQYRIPIDRAMQLLAEEAYRRQKGEGASK